MIPLRKKESRRKLFESEERNSEMMTATALAGRSRSSSRTEGTKREGGERVERGWQTGNSGEKSPLFCTRDVRAGRSEGMKAVAEIESGGQMALSDNEEFWR